MVVESVRCEWCVAVVVVVVVVGVVGGVIYAFLS
jgi:hypothetical protein